MVKHDPAVLIVGGGPVGMTVAAELGRRGISCRLIDSGNGYNDHPRANVVSPRTMEHFRRWGIDEDVLRAGLPDASDTDVIFTTRLLSHEITRFRFPSISRIRNPDIQLLREHPEINYSPYYKTAVGQNFLEPVLRRYVQSLPSVQLDLDTALTDLRQEHGVVVASLREPDGRTRIVSARFLVACDGARSTVRELLGIPMQGRSALGQNVGIYFRSPELLARMQKGPGILYWTFAPTCTGVFVAIDGRQYWVMQRHLHPHETVDTIDPQACVAAAIGGDVPFEILSVKPWIARQLVADSYRTGSVFLAGDAAHLVSPTGGFGMNTGIGDGVDIGWKLAAVLEGWAGDDMLDTYEEERKPVAFRNAVEATDNRVSLDASSLPPPAIEDATDEGEAVRTQWANRIQKQRKHFAAVGIHLGYRYEGSRLIVPDGTPAPPDEPDRYVPTARPGSRAPHIWLAKNVSILDRFGTGFSLLRFSRDRPLAACTAIAERLGVPLTVIDIDNPAAAALYACDLALIRPDGHVAWRGSRAEEAATALPIVSAAAEKERAAAF